MRGNISRMLKNECTFRLISSCFWYSYDDNKMDVIIFLAWLANCTMSIKLGSMLLIIFYSIVLLSAINPYSPIWMEERVR